MMMAEVVKLLVGPTRLPVAFHISTAEQYVVNESNPVTVVFVTVPPAEILSVHVPQTVPTSNVLFTTVDPSPNDPSTHVALAVEVVMSVNVGADGRAVVVKLAVGPVTPSVAFHISTATQYRVPPDNPVNVAVPAGPPVENRSVHVPQVVPTRTV